MSTIMVGQRLRAAAQSISAALLVALSALLLLMSLAPDAVAQSKLRLPENAQAAPSADGVAPGGALGPESRVEIWRAVREGVRGEVVIPDKKAGLLVQPDGDAWRAIRNGPLSKWGLIVLGGMAGLLAVFYLLRGRIRIEHGPAGVTITRFSGLERMGHWLLAVSFILLALSGLNMLYGRYVLPGVIGKAAFASLAGGGKLVHNTVAFAFMAGLTWVFLSWALHNLPSRADLLWMAQVGGLFSKGVHPPARKFNAGQKVIFWLSVLGGLSLALSGWALLFPFTTSMFSDTFAVVNGVAGSALPTSLEPVQEQQYAQLWHSMMGLFLTAVIIAHIYLGTLGMEGAFDAMTSGEVDLNWAKEHHSLWVEEEQAKGAAGAAAQAPPTPAE